MLKTRVLAALVFTPVVFAMVWLGGHYLIVTCALLALLMQWEYLGLTLSRRDWELKLLGYGLALTACLGTMGQLESVEQEVLWPLSTVLAFVVVLLRPEPIDKALRRVSYLVVGIVYAGVLIAHLYKLREIGDASLGLGQPGLGYAQIGLLGTWGADTGAYFIGRGFGRTKLYPSISPKKTVEGLIGGMVCAMAIAFAFRSVLGLPLGVIACAGLGAVVGVSSVLGDLSASMIKRSVGAKDSSQLIPGHGGVIDRFDGVIFVAPCAYFYLYFTGYAT